ncbi:thioredoxin domain-containing protein [Actinacidiphila acididurans]|uniref:Thioredoxin domain-containing protein n=1 Tax=Actinacidiphila acididurans TaxID=2784346 RepID=A0ABS2TQC2_9ACTN|nr:thioredoxin domain-containing protein [Actinacidiphila acididurans]MBM9505533.1 thioredoxin domain-containing protein [Actinacidiphila acididurans]
MSQRNSLANKAAAREKLREQREKDAKRSKVRRQVVVGVGVVALLAVAGGVAVAVNQMNKPGYWSDAAKKPLVQPANTSGTNGSTIVVGDKNNKNNLDLYEDLRCPACAQLEQTQGAAILQGEQAGKYKITYHFGDFLDDRLKGTGSKNALSAVGAAVNVSTDAFVQFHTLLYSTAHHPDESGPDLFASDSHVLSIADLVPALKSNTAFQTAVKNGTYDKWALDSADAFNKAGIQATPTIVFNGKQLTADNVTSEIDQALGAKK